MFSLLVVNWRCFSMSKTIERYQKRSKDQGLNGKSEGTNQHVKEDTQSLEKKLELLEVSKRKLLGDGLELCPIDELQQVENQLERSLTKIRARKNQLYREQIEQLREQEKFQLEENAKLRAKCGLPPLHPSSKQREVNRRSLDVETELFIGPPKR
ncbi:agamous-like mads-box protein agl19 [Quercus suber]|uniref:Agamous-like mads-box protein agl19 n=1 Tax=Quercus suber TaxID=58331 RepID=A0AAW0JQH7_QUESU